MCSNDLEIAEPRTQQAMNSSDDEDLPDIFTSSQEQSKQVFEIKPGDIVWAEYRKLYWPALVRTVSKKSKIASVWYLDSPKACFKVKFNKIKSFSDAESSKLIRQEVENSPVKAKHEKVLLNALTFMRRKSEGFKDNPAAYFDLSGHYLTFQDPKFSGQDYGDVTNDDEEMETDTEDEISEEESIIGSDDEDTKLSEKISRFIDVEETDEDKEKTQAIVDCITAGHVDRYLLRIKNKKIPSTYQDIFEDAMKTDRKKLFNITACSIVKNLQKLKEISFYLLNFYESVVEGGKCEMLDYVTSVWLPEAIDKADEIIREGKVSDSSSDARKGTRRKLFPSDKLEISETPDYIGLSQHHEESELSSKTVTKRGRPKKKAGAKKDSLKSKSKRKPRRKN